MDFCPTCFPPCFSTPYVPRSALFPFSAQMYLIWATSSSRKIWERIQNCLGEERFLDFCKSRDRDFPETPRGFQKCVRSYDTNSFGIVRKFSSAPILYVIHGPRICQCWSWLPFAATTSLRVFLRADYDDLALEVSK